MNKIEQYLTLDSKTRLKKLKTLFLPNINLEYFNDFWNDKCNKSNTISFKSSKFTSSYKDDLGLKEKNYKKELLIKNKEF
jgi:hypothetical protein